jgi:hypothetical protein
VDKLTKGNEVQKVTVTIGVNLMYITINTVSCELKLIRKYFGNWKTKLPAEQVETVRPHADKYSKAISITSVSNCNLMIKSVGNYSSKGQSYILAKEANSCLCKVVTIGYMAVNVVLAMNIPYQIVVKFFKVDTPIYPFVLKSAKCHILAKILHIFSSNYCVQISCKPV